MHVIQALNDGRVPAALQEELLARANAYAEHPSARTRLAFHKLVR
jgi:hypothetical protein